MMFVPNKNVKYFVKYLNGVKCKMIVGNNDLSGKQRINDI
jgi:hypothetical protein